MKEIIERMMWEKFDKNAKPYDRTDKESDIRAAKKDIIKVKSFLSKKANGYSIVASVKSEYPTWVITKDRPTWKSGVIRVMAQGRPLHGGKFTGRYNLSAEHPTMGWSGTGAYISNLTGSELVKEIEKLIDLLEKRENER